MGITSTGGTVKYFGLMFEVNDYTKFKKGEWDVDVLIKLDGIEYAMTFKQFEKALKPYKATP